MDAMEDRIDSLTQKRSQVRVLFRTVATDRRGLVDGSILDLRMDDGNCMRLSFISRGSTPRTYKISTASGEGIVPCEEFN